MGGELEDIKLPMKDVLEGLKVAGYEMMLKEMKGKEY